MSIGDVTEMTFSDIDFDDIKPMIEKFNDFRFELHKLLYQYKSDNIERELWVAEKKIGVKREYVKINIFI